MIRTAIARTVACQPLTFEQARASMEQILSGEATPAQIAGLAVGLRMKGESAQEIAGMAEAMRARIAPLHTRRRPLLDTCGTGGDEAGTFNISTAAALVTASCGVAVAKHGNRAVSSRTGSADVLEALGVSIDIAADKAARSLDLLGITFLFAPSYHTSLRHAAGPRREIGVRTVFNVLGPLTNPAGATRQLLGVYSDGLVILVAQVLTQLGSERAWVVHGHDGLDELTVFAETHVAELDQGRIHEFVVDPGAYGLRHDDRSPIAGSDAGANAARIRSVFAGEKSAARDIVVLNAGAALVVAGAAADLAEGVTRAARAIDSGAAAAKLSELAAFRG